MSGPLQGLQGLNSGATPSQQTDQGVLEAHAAPGTGSGHSNIGDTSGQEWPAAWGTGYEGTSYGPNVSTSSQTGRQLMPAGSPLDRTPDVHSAPWPAGYAMDGSTQESIDRAAGARDIQRRKLHSLDKGASRLLNFFSPAGRETPVDTSVDRYTAPNQTGLSGELSGQLKSAGTGGGASKDTTQGLGALNDTPEFQAGHSIRIIQHDPMHWDRSLDYAPPQPFWGRRGIGESSFDVDSPYGQVAGDTSTGQQVVWEGRIGYPSPYNPPAEPVTIPSATAPESEAWAYG